MALKYGRSTPKTTDPQGNRIADLEVRGKKVSTGTVSSWPEVREMYKSGKLDESLKGRKLNPEVISYLKGNDKLSDTEFDEPILSYITGASGAKIPTFESNYKKGGKNYEALNKQGKKYNDNIGPGMMRVIDSGQRLSDVTDWASGGSSIGTDLDVFRTKVIKPKTNIIPPPPPPPNKTEPTAESMDISNLRLKPLPAGKLPMKGGKLKEGPAAPDEWNAPELRKRSKVKATILKRKNGETAQNPVFNGRTISRTKPDRLEYNREKKTSSAYFGDNVFVGEVTGKNAAELKDMKKETKQIRNEALSRGSIKSALALQKDVKQLRLSGEYAKKGDISKQYGTGKIIEGKNSKLDYFTAEGTKGVNNERGITERAPGAMAGYKEDKAYKKQQAFSSSMSNMANRNTVAKQTAALSGVDSYVASPMAQAKAALRTANPDMSNKEVRQGAKKQRVEDKNIMKTQAARMKTN